MEYDVLQSENGIYSQTSLYICNLYIIQILHVFLIYWRKDTFLSQIETTRGQTNVFEVSHLLISRKLRRQLSFASDISYFNITIIATVCYITLFVLQSVWEKKIHSVRYLKGIHVPVNKGSYNSQSVQVQISELLSKTYIYSDFITLSVYLKLFCHPRGLTMLVGKIKPLRRFLC